ncbi:CDC50/LEM3 family [Mucidula mucida]|nr:CDC50/LEM3 family [Mucidula mucida]
MARTRKRRAAGDDQPQQRLKAWQPILTPKTVLPTFFILGILFGPIGGLLIWGSSLVSEMTFDYTQCQSLDAYTYRMKDSGLNPSKPQYALLNNTNNDTITDVSQELECILRFNVPTDLDPTVLIYYKLTNFYQNHRRYVKSLNSDQLKGDFVSTSDLDDSDCKPLGTRDGKAIYPCGLIANSLFNDTFSSPVLLNPPSGVSATYDFTTDDISWPGEAKKYATTPISEDGYNSVNGYTDDNIPNLKTDFHFQNWMRTAGLPTFTKLYGRNDNDVMRSGTYQITIGMSV